MCDTSTKKIATGLVHEHIRSFYIPGKNFCGYILILRAFKEVWFIASFWSMLAYLDPMDQK